jgi:hypothetical protein
MSLENASGTAQEAFTGRGQEMVERKYTPGARAALWSLSGGFCYYPGCQEPILVRVGTDWEIGVEIAHIHALKKGGSRYVDGLTDDQANDFSNLILLCTAHHKHVDRLDHAHQDPAEVLRRWKAQRETAGMAELQGLRGLTEDRLRDLLVSAQSEREERLDRAIGRLEQVDSESAALIRALMTELEEVRKMKVGLDPDVVRAFARAAERLRESPDHVARFRRTVDEYRRYGPQV